jgi:hypothetical protein
MTFHVQMLAEMEVAQHPQPAQQRAMGPATSLGQLAVCSKHFFKKRPGFIFYQQAGSLETFYTKIPAFLCPG